MNPPCPICNNFIDDGDAVLNLFVAGNPTTVHAHCAKEIVESYLEQLEAKARLARQGMVSFTVGGGDLMAQWTPNQERAYYSSTEGTQR